MVSMMIAVTPLTLAGLNKSIIWRETSVAQFPIQAAKLDRCMGLCKFYGNEMTL